MLVTFIATDVIGETSQRCMIHNHLYYFMYAHNKGSSMLFFLYDVYWQNINLIVK